MTLRNSRGKSPCISYEAKSLLPTAFGELLPTQLLALVHLLSRSYAPAAYPECHQNATAISRIVGAHAPAVIPGYIYGSSPSRSSSCTKSFTYTLRVARGYHVKLQRKEYTT